MADATAQDEVVRVVARAHEPDRYLAALLAPRPIRADLIALAAFAGEVGRIPLSVSEPMMGRMRLQWWRERLDEGTGGGHPVAEAILSVAQRHDLPKGSLTELVDAQDDALDQAPFPDLAAVARHAERVEGTSFTLASRIAGAPLPAGLVGDAARAYGLARLALETPARRAHGRSLLPATTSDAAAEAQLEAVAALARQHRAASSAAVRQLSRAARNAILPLALVEPYLQALQRSGFHPEARPEISPLVRVWKLWRCHRNGTA